MRWIGPDLERTQLNFTRRKDSSYLASGVVIRVQKQAGKRKVGASLPACKADEFSPLNIGKF